MIMLLIASVLLGLTMGRLFKVFALVPVCCLVVALAFAGPWLGYESLTYSLIDSVPILAALQIGYFLAFAVKNFHAAPRAGTWSARPHSVPSRPFHFH
jgi:hypothetical protein